MCLRIGTLSMASIVLHIGRLQCVFVFLFRCSITINSPPIVAIPATEHRSLLGYSWNACEPLAEGPWLDTLEWCVCLINSLVVENNSFDWLQRVRVCVNRYYLLAYFALPGVCLHWNVYTMCRRCRILQLQSANRLSLLWRIYIWSRIRSHFMTNRMPLEASIVQYNGI